MKVQTDKGGGLSSPIIQGNVFSVEALEKTRRVQQKEGKILLKRSSLLLVVVLLVGLIATSCGPADPEETPNGDPDSKYGGVLKNAFYAATHMDPAFLGSITDAHVGRQWSDFLVFIDEENEPDINRSVAEKWEFDDTGTVWTFTLRKGIKFHDGKEMTARDVKFTFDRLRDPEVGAITVEMYSNISEITTPDDYTVVFQLKNPNPEFLKDLAEYHALIMDADNTNFATNFNGTGPFIVEQYIPEDRIVFKRNPDYWMKDEDGNQLPYLDGMEFIFIDDPSAQVEALRGGQVDYLIYLPIEFVPTLEEDPNIEIYEKPSNQTYLIRMRSDRPPANDVRVRQALKLGTDRSAILDGAIEGYGVTGRDTPIGPSYRDSYLDIPEPKRDVEKAKELLAEAGYADGLEITLYTMAISPVPAIATIWREQMADIGVTVNIQMVPSDVYLGADDMWLEVDFGITDWAARPYPQHYLDLAYVTDAPWNESHWSDSELDELAETVAQEMDPKKRIELYHEIQEIFIERGPVIIPFFASNLWGARENVKGIRPTSALGMALDLRSVYFED